MKQTIILTLALLAGPARAKPDSETKPSPNNPCNLSPAALENQALQEHCKSGFQITGYPMHQSDDGWKKKYIAQYPVDCYIDNNDLLQCYFSTTDAACAAAVVMANTIENLGTKWKLEKFTANNSTSKDGKCVMDVLPLPKTGEPTRQLVPLTWQAKPARSTKLSFPNLGVTTFAGPYRNQSDPSQVAYGQALAGPVPGMAYSGKCTAVTANGKVVDGADNKPLQLNTIILGMNAAAHGGKITSDLAGYPYVQKGNTPCIKKHPSKAGWCVEPDVLGGGPQDSPQVHHMVPAHYPAGCDWGANSMANATVISAQLNRYFSNDYPEEDAVKKAKAIAPYATFPVGP